MRKGVLTQMLIRRFRRFIAEAFSGMIKNGLMTIASVVVVTSCLIMLGVFLLVTLNVNNISNEIADSCQVKAIVTDEAQADKAKLDKIESEIKKIKYTKDVTYENGVKYFAEIKESMTPDDRKPLEGLPEDLLNDAFNVSVDDITHTDKIAKLISEIDGVKEVQNGHDVITFINTIRVMVQRVSFWIILLFMMISIFIISNTIKLTVHNRRKEINIMKYVGATDSYIRWPFIIEGIMVGVLSAAIAYGITSSVYGAICKTVIQDNSIVKFLELMDFNSIWKIFVLSYAGLGAVIGALGSAFSVRKYLKV